MQVILDTDEAWSIMTLVVSQVVDQADLSDEGKTALRRWRSDHTDGTAEMSDLTVSMNESIGAIMDEKTTRLLRRKGWYVSSGDSAAADAKAVEGA
ncbi:MAG TPA: hypothetical protein VI759_06630 [Dehalococcoidia bacterium]|nr:hypothetical protein [Dehalococcoidia bacterium]